LRLICDAMFAMKRRRTIPRRLSAPSRKPRRTAVNTAIFSVATGLSRIAGLVREVVAARYFGTTGPMSAFTAAFQVPNLIRSLFADAALSAAFVPVFTELLEHDKRKEALQLAAALFGLILASLTAITAVFIAGAELIMPLFTEDPDLEALTVGLSRVLFPIVILLGLNGLLVGMLNAHDHFTVPALSPLVWNLVIIGGLVALTPLFEGDDRIYAYAIGVLAGTACQFAMAFPVLRRLNIPIRISFDWRDLRIRRVLLLMLPVTIGLGLINFNLLINTYFGFRISEEAPAAIDKAFRIYMLPQGIFSVAVSTVLFPTLSRFAARRELDSLRATMANGMRQIVLLLIPAAAAILVLSEPMVRLIYERGEFGTGATELVSTALFWFAFSLPFNGLFLLLTRTFFSLQRPWIPTAISMVNLLITAIFSLILYGPFGVAGIVSATAIATAVSVLAQAFILRGLLGRLELGRLAWTGVGVLVASALLASTAYGVWYALDELLGRALVAQVISLGLGLAAGGAIYAVAVSFLGYPEVAQIRRVVRRRG
jgi:putative peptidoglycan lipid II flippase